MALPKYYDAGTISVANGSTSVTGVGTAWLNLVKADDRLTVDGYSVRIASVENNNALTLAHPWPGTSLADDAYEIAITYDGPELLLRVRELVEGLESSSEIAEYTGLVATGGVVLNSRSTTNKQIMSRSRHLAREKISSLQLVFANWYVTTSGVETALGGSATLTASVEYPSGVFTQVLFSGATSIAMADGSTNISDAVSVEIPDGAEFWVRTFVTSATGIVFALTAAGGSYGATDEYGASGLTDKTMSGTITDAGDNTYYAPTAIIGTTSKASIALLGDSRASGDNDTQDETMDVGNLSRSLSPQFATMNLSRGSDQAQWFVSSHTKRAALANAYATHVVIEYGINDLRVASRTAAQLKADIETIIGYFADKTVIVATLEPVSTSSDSWATTANQTTHASNSERVTYNGYVRGGITGAADYFDIADALESSRNSGKWKVTGSANGYTADGIHANRAGNKLVRDLGVVDPQKVVEPRRRFATRRDAAYGIGGNLILSAGALMGGLQRFVPTLVGTTSAGVGTYSFQDGYYFDIGPIRFYVAQMSWSAHTGTGNMRVSLPFSSALAIGIPASIEVANVTFSNQLCAETNLNEVRISTFSSGGGLSGVPIDTAGSLIVSGWAYIDPREL